VPRTARRAAAFVLALSVSLALAAAGCPPAEAGPPPVDYQPPVPGPVIDPFRPPATPYGPGNRGVDYATVPGAPVAASAAGEVVFAGRIGFGQHVVVLHADGLRSSYSFLASVSVRRGDRVAAGQPVGTSGATLHFGFRAGETYLDPMALLGQGPLRVWLVPDDERRPLSEGRERSWLERGLRGLARTAAGATAAGVRWAGETTVDLAQLAVRTSPALALVAHEAEPWTTAVEDWWRQRDDCTPWSAPAPRLTERHLAVLVGGLGSRAGSASVLEVDTAAIGYAPGDVVQFSYRGGTTADTTYAPPDTQIDMAVAGQRLRALIERLSAQNPGVPIDVVAHSQGGVVTRFAMGSDAPAAVASVVTLASPHQGADLATVGRMVDATIGGRVALTEAGAANRERIDFESTSVRQLATVSPERAAAYAQPLPAGPRWVSLGARADLVVPAPRTRLAGAENATAALSLGFDHSNLPGSGPGQRQVALAVTGRPLACRGLLDRMVDVTVGQAISSGETTAGGVLAQLTGAPLPPRL
jgi:murein DD-endopeptidase MepM/ murein hydrolase activator NlpD